MLKKLGRIFTRASALADPDTDLANISDTVSSPLMLYPPHYPPVLYGIRISQTQGERRRCFRLPRESSLPFYACNRY